MDLKLSDKKCLKRNSLVQMTQFVRHFGILMLYQSMTGEWLMIDKQLTATQRAGRNISRQWSFFDIVQYHLTTAVLRCTIINFNRTLSIKLNQSHHQLHFKGWCEVWDRNVFFPYSMLAIWLNSGWQSLQSSFPWLLSHLTASTLFFTEMTCMKIFFPSAVYG